MTTQLAGNPTVRSEDALVRTAMRVDAVLVGVVGIPFVAAARPLAEWTGIPQAFVLGLGIFFLVYAVDVYWLAGRDRVAPGAWATIVANDVCTLAALAVVVLGVWPLTGVGVAALLFSAVYTAVFAAAQWIGLRRLG